jgi:hypothetical protein
LRAEQKFFKMKKNKTIPFFFLTCLVLLTSCGKRPVVINTSPSSDFAIASDIDIIILRPLLRFERVQDEAPLPASAYEGDVFEARLHASARDIIDSKKFALFDARAHQELRMVELCEQLCLGSPNLSTGIVSGEIQNSLRQLASFNERLAVLVQFLRVKIGPGGYYNPSTGQMGSSMSSSLLQASLIHCATGKVLWKSQVFQRGLLLAKSSQLSEMLMLLYQNFPKR